jgi:8-oxo-dGTP pyrophosphatase MutT (NUDIX family)
MADSPLRDSSTPPRELLSSSELNALGPRATLQLFRERIAATLVDAAVTTTAELRADTSKGRAAVAIIVRDSTHGPEILLIRRAERASDPWSGHMAFPGGREEPHDPDLLSTAVRETHEEVAIDLTEAGRLLGPLTVLPAVARGKSVGMTIAPFVFELTRDVELSYNVGEVSEALWVPVEPMMRGTLHTTIPYELAGQRLTLPAHDVQGRIVWGLTYRMLDNLFALLR